MIKKRNFIWLLPLSLIITFPLWRPPVSQFLTPRGHTDTLINPTDRTHQSFTMENVRITQAQDGIITAEIRAKSAYTTSRPNEYMMKTVDADLYDKNGDPTAITAQSGFFDGQLNYLTLKDQVVITKKSSDHNLYTDLFYYNDLTRAVHCPSATRIEGNGITITGTSLDYDIENGLYQMGGRVECLITQ